VRGLMTDEAEVVVMMGFYKGGRAAWR